MIRQIMMTGQMMGGSWYGPALFKLLGRRGWGVLTLIIGIIWSVATVITQNWTYQYISRAGFIRPGVWFGLMLIGIGLLLIITGRKR